METAAVVSEHAPWCVRKHTRGQCSEKRGHWDRSTNTWDSDLTQKDREAIRDALRLYRNGVVTYREAALYVRRNSENLTDIEDGAFLTWNMTARKYEKRGKTWPV